MTPRSVRWVAHTTSFHTPLPRAYPGSSGPAVPTRFQYSDGLPTQARLKFGVPRRTRFGGEFRDHGLGYALLFGAGEDDLILGRVVNDYEIVYVGPAQPDERRLRMTSQRLALLGRTRRCSGNMTLFMYRLRSASMKMRIMAGRSASSSE